jgi:hypothetical protein
VDAPGKVGSDAAQRGGRASVGWQGATGAAHVLVEGRLRRGGGGLGGDPAARGGGEGES